MSQRLGELQRQRALLQEHLAWLEREIAAETFRVSGPRPEPARSAPAAATSSQLPEAAATTRVSSGTAPDATLAGAADSTFATSVNLAPPAPVPPVPLGGGNADAILDQYRVAPDSLRKDVRKGCFLYFTLAFVLLGIGVGALYVLFRL